MYTSTPEQALKNLPGRPSDGEDHVDEAPAAVRGRIPDVQVEEVQDNQEPCKDLNCQCVGNDDCSEFIKKKSEKKIKMKNRQYRSNQGRSPRQQRGNYIIMMITVVGMVLVLGYLVLINNLNL